MLLHFADLGQHGAIELILFGRRDVFLLLLIPDLFELRDYQQPGVAARKILGQRVVCPRLHQQSQFKLQGFAEVDTLRGVGDSAAEHLGGPGVPVLLDLGRECLILLPKLQGALRDAALLGDLLV